MTLYLRGGSQGHLSAERNLLVTDDDSVPTEHAAVIAETAATVETIHPVGRRASRGAVAGYPAHVGKVVRNRVGGALGDAGARRAARNRFRDRVPGKLIDRRRVEGTRRDR